MIESVPSPSTFCLSGKEMSFDPHTVGLNFRKKQRKIIELLHQILIFHY
jgi:hypothetical protein